ncbi:MAG: chloride channel protein, partial [Clostridiales bacterium]|nr:chloride channel protein [Clostridiales bacterium]
IVLLYRISGMADDQGTNLILHSVRTSDSISLRTAPLILAGTLLTHVCGGSAGREGAALQLGGSIAAWIGRCMRLDERSSRTMTMCGMSAAFSALFLTPVAAAVFSIEVISVGVMYYSAIVPCFLSAVIASLLSSQVFGIVPVSFRIFGIPELSAVSVIQVLALGALCAVVSALFCAVLHHSSRFVSRILKNQYLRVLAASAVLIGLTLLIGIRDYNGAGMSVIDRAMDGTARPEAFLLKILFTAITISGGFRGGEIVPAFFTGAVFGNTAGAMLGLNPSFGAGLGLVAVFCGVTNCPLTSMLLSVELFGAEGFVFFGMICAVCYLLSGYTGLYTEQKIVYSKTEPTFVDRHAH